MKYVYLAGPILGCDHDEANDWREHVDVRMQEAIRGLVGISPLRCEPLHGERYAFGGKCPLTTGRGIGGKNEFDVRNCDFVFAYLPKPAEGRLQSYGTLIEIGWARMLNKPVILVSGDPILQQHPVVGHCCDWKVETLDEGIEIIVGLLGGYEGGKNI